MTPRLHQALERLHETLDADYTGAIFDGLRALREVVEAYREMGKEKRA